MVNNHRIDINLSEKGFFIDGQRLNMLNYRFHEILNRSGMSHIGNKKKSAPDSNCAIFYVYHSDAMAYISLMDIWFTPDESPITQKDFDRLEKFYEETDSRFNEQNYKYKLSAKINLDILEKIGRGEEFTIPTGIDETTYTAAFYSPSKTGLYCFHLDINPIFTEEFWESDKYKTEARLFESVNNGDLEKIKLYAKKGANLKFHAKYTLASLLDIAIVNNNPQMCEFLIRQGLDVNYTNGYGPDFSSLNLAKSEKALEAGKVLVKYGARYDLFNLIEAGTFSSEDCNRLYMEELEFLLQCGSDANKGLKNNLFTPLMWAVFNNNIQAAELLIKYGADINAKTISDGTALRIAVLNNNVKMASFLIEHGAEVNSITDGKSNLLEALIQQNPDREMISLLSLCGGKINASLPVPVEVYNKKLNVTFVIKEAFVPYFLKEDEEALLFLWKLFLLCDTAIPVHWERV
ncbi:ankyrin repeat domain-containing protein [Treponema sp. UBA3813]|uniref:ankyrin repeat domain-containing protein n=1 Tax=Treponema sp. UBA3813 TaxID=1947715 RepID=UPI0025D939AA|nr:ankyrin repeat domain-containing protein [Treponema sp. UBA3813]